MICYIDFSPDSGSRLDSKATYVSTYARRGSRWIHSLNHPSPMYYVFAKSEPRVPTSFQSYKIRNLEIQGFISWEEFGKEGPDLNWTWEISNPTRTGTWNQKREWNSDSEFKKFSKEELDELRIWSLPFWAGLRGWDKNIHASWWADQKHVTSQYGME